MAPSPCEAAFAQWPARRSGPTGPTFVPKAQRVRAQVLKPEDDWLASGAHCATLWSTMKTATVRELRNRYTQLLKWLDAGEEILITRRGVTIARLVPEKARTKPKVDWKESAAFQLDRLKLRPLTAQESAEMLELNRGPH